MDVGAVSSAVGTAPRWAGVNCEAEGFAKTICHDESSLAEDTASFFLFVFWLI